MNYYDYIRCNIFVEKIMDNEFVTIAAFDNPLEANILKSKLESEGIECFLPDENIISVNMLYSTAVGNIKVQVQKKHLKNAKEILTRDEGGLRSKTTDSESSIEALTRCPNCNSFHLEEYIIKKKYPWISILFLGFPVIFTSKKWKCGECNTVWSEKIPITVQIVRAVFACIVLVFFAVFIATIIYSFK